MQNQKKEKLVDPIVFANMGAGKMAPKTGVMRNSKITKINKITKQTQIQTCSKCCDSFYYEATYKDEANANTSRNTPGIDAV